MGGRSRTRNGLGVGIAVALTVVAVVAVTPSQSVVAGPPVGGVWVVNSAGDASDLAIDGNCNVGGDVCTLRAALAEAEAELASPTDAAADIRIEVAPSDPILVGAEMLVSVEVGDMLTIGAAVPPADRPVLDGGGSDRIFNFSGGGRINLNGLILQNGSELDASGGGAILTDSELWLDRVTVRDSDSTNTGGAVFSTALLDIKFSEFTGNNAFLGGAIRGMAWTRINDTIISGNDGQQGGGIYIESVLDIADSLVIDNGATNGGGGIFCSCSNANVIRTSLIRNVTAGGTGGGMYAEAYFGGPPFFVARRQLDVLPELRRRRWLWPARRDRRRSRVDQRHDRRQLVDDRVGPLGQQLRRRHAQHDQQHRVRQHRTRRRRQRLQHVRLRNRRHHELHRRRRLRAAGWGHAPQHRSRPPHRGPVRWRRQPRTVRRRADGARHLGDITGARRRDVCRQHPGRCPLRQAQWSGVRHRGVRADVGRGWLPG